MTIEQTLADRCKIFVDESFLLHENGQQFLRNRLLKALQTTPAGCLIIPVRVHQHLVSVAKDAKAPRNSAARSALGVIAQFEKHKRLARSSEERGVLGEKVGTSDVFVRIVYQWQLKHELAFLTQDESCARALLESNLAQAVRNPKTLRVLRVAGSSATLEDWSGHYSSISEPERKQYARSVDLSALVHSTKIFIDTCSLMTEASTLFVEGSLIPALLASGKQLLVAKRVYAELDSHIEPGPHGSGHAPGAGKDIPVNDMSRSERAQNGRRLLQILEDNKLLDLRHETNEVAGNDRFFDAIIARVFVQLQKNAKLLLITQDTALARQIFINARNLDAIETAPKVAFINQVKKELPVGALGNWEWRLTWDIYEQSHQVAAVAHDTKTARSQAARSTNARLAADDNTPSAAPTGNVPPFKIAQSAYRGGTGLLSVKLIPDEGSKVVGDLAGPFTLTKKLSQGGEGIIYRTSIPDRVCKVYLKDRLTEDRQKKLERMVSRQVPDKAICWPQELVRNAAGEFVGYLMPLAKGETFNAIVFRAPAIRETFPSWGREHLVQLGITTLGIIKRLHAMNVLIGDINANNFMVVNEHEVYLVDTDSFQVEEFPCPVGLLPFVPPELLTANFATILRTPDHELFNVATLLFMILMLGKPPYTGQDAGDIKESIANHRFPYVRQEGERSIKPYGVFPFIWSHLHYNLRQDFIEIFHEDRRIPRPDKDARHPGRPTTNYVDRLLYDLNVYLDSIRKGRLSNELSPKEHYVRPDQELVEIPCAESRCTRTSRMPQTLYDELRRQNPDHTFRCTQHHEVNKLRRATMRVRQAQRAAQHGAPTGAGRHQNPQRNPHAYQSQLHLRPTPTAQPVRAAQPRHSASPPPGRQVPPTRQAPPGTGGTPAWKLHHVALALAGAFIAVKLIGSPVASPAKPPEERQSAAPEVVKAPPAQPPVIQEAPPQSVQKTKKPARKTQLPQSGQRQQPAKQVAPPAPGEDAGTESTSLDLDKYRSLTQGMK